MDTIFKNVVKTLEELREISGKPGAVVNKKVIHSIDHHCREFISKSPFLTIGTTNGEGSTDVSPRGDTPGFVHIIDEKHLIIPERPGNRRLDSIINILSHPYVGVLFFIPGLGETLRVNGKACVIKDEELLEPMTVQGKRPVLGIGIEVEECFIHCAKAFIRSGLWQPDSWMEKENLPLPAKILKDHIQMPEIQTKDIEDDLEASYKHTLY